MIYHAAKDGQYYIVTDRWQNFTDETVTTELLDKLSSYCCEFLVHAVDVEGRVNGIEKELVAMLGGWGSYRSHMQEVCHPLTI